MLLCFLTCIKEIGNMSKLLRALILLGIFLGLGVTCASAANVISLNPQTIYLRPDATQNVQIVMDKVPTGISGFNITISISNPEIAEITAISPPVWVGMSGTSAVPSSSVWIKAVNFGQVHAGDTNVLLGNITISGKKEGTADMNIVPTEIDDDNGDSINPVMIKGKVNVVLIPINVSIIPQNFELNPLSSQNFQIVMDKVPNGLSGFNITVYILDPTIAEITSASSPSWNGIQVNSTSAVPSSSVWIKAVNFGQIHAGDINVSLGNINLTGKNEGTTDLSIQPTAIEDDNGDPINVQVINGKVKVVNIPSFPNCAKKPTDMNNDGLYEDINGNGRLDFADVVLYYNNMAWITQSGLVAYLDYNRNGRIDFNDVVKLYIMH
jgi:PKD repeat protein